MTKTTKTTKTTLKPTKYVPRLIINGQVVTQHAKQVTTTIKGTEVTLTCCYVNEHELNDAYNSSFNTTIQNKHIEVHYVKVQNRISATLYINEVIAFSSVTMQSIFTILNSAYGISKSTLNTLYIKSNAMRKQSAKSVNSITINDTFEF